MPAACQPAAPAGAQTITLRYADQFPPVHTASRLSARPFQEPIAEALGAVTVQVPASDLCLALDRGTADGAIYNTPSLFACNIKEVLAATTTNASLGTVVFAALINQDIWQGPPEYVQDLLMEVGEEVGTAMAARFQAATAGATRGWPTWASR